MSRKLDLDALPLSAFVVDRHGALREVNARGRRLPKETLPGLADVLARALRGEDLSEHVSIGVGTARMVCGVHVAPLRDGDEIVGAIALVDEVVSRAGDAAGRAVLGSRLALLFESSTDAIFFTKPDGTIVRANPAAEAMFRRAEQDLCAVGRAGLVDPTDPRVTEAIERRDRTGRFAGVLQFRRGDGTVFDGDISSGVFLERGQEFTMTIVRDVSERTAAAAELVRARDAAEAGMRARSDFLAMMSHEIRTPMNAIVGLSGLVLERGLADEQRESVETIRDSANTLLGIINDILDFSKIESGHLELEMGRVSLRECVEDALELARAQATAKGLALGYAATADVPRWLRSDATRLRQIVVNLVSNAVKFTTTGHVMVRASTLARSDGEIDLRVAVADTGVGIAPERIDALFRAFTQADASITRRFGGTGLGLAISQRIAQALGGSIAVRSEVGRGSTFELVIPIAIEHDTEPDAPLDGATLGVVEPRAAMREAWSSLARDLSCEAMIVADPVELEAAVRAGPLDALIISDACTAIEPAAIPGGPPLVIVHAVAAAPDFPQALQARCVGRIAEPLRLSRVQAVLARALLRAQGNEPTRPPATVAPRLHILVAEDNPVNQQVARRLLVHLGHDCDVVANGIELLAALEVRRYDVVLLDVNMPELDGLAATRRIRARERPGEHQRIVAVTANAMVGDREQCLDAGCDDYLGKPLRLEDLRAALDRSANGSIAPQVPAPDEVLDRRTLDSLRALGAKAGRDVSSELLKMFVRDARPRLDRLREAAVAGDAVAGGSIAHSFRGSSGAIGATRLAELLATFEAQASTGLIDPLAIEALSDELARVEAAIDSLIARDVTAT